MKPTEQAQSLNKRILQLLQEYSYQNDTRSNQRSIIDDDFNDLSDDIVREAISLQPEWVACNIVSLDDHIEKLCQEYHQQTFEQVRFWMDEGDIISICKEAAENYANQFKGISMCEIHGHSLQPVVGFDNEITDYQCLGCGIFESQLPQPPTK